VNVALILAGGVGQRVGLHIPKQFLEVRGKPILAYTLSVFQNHPDIDKICVVCVDGWEQEVESYVERFGITKLIKIIKGGDSNMMSIRNGVYGIGDIADKNDIVVVHDGVRPLIDGSIITDCIEKCKEFGNGCASIPLQETIVRTEDRISGKVNIDRSEVMRVQTPQAYRFDDIYGLYSEAERVGITDSVYVNTLKMELGGTIYFSKGSSFNLKITTRDDLEMFDLLLNRTGRN